MRLTTKSRYAITAMLDLALSGPHSPIPLAEISEKQSISLSYLEQLFSALRAKGLVRGVRGPGGGYHLGRDATEISIADIICSVDEWVEYTHARARPTSTPNEECSARTLWEDLSGQIFGFVADITLQDLVERGLEKRVVANESRAAAVGLGSYAA